jgi:hypothetical protein
MSLSNGWKRSPTINIASDGSNFEGEPTMTTWSKDELRKIAEADDLHISPFREDGVTYGTPTWIWSVAVDGALYVRGYNGQNSRWYQAAVRQKAGRIIAAAMTKEGHLRAGGRTDQQPHRRRLPGEVPWQPIPQPDDRGMRSLRDGQGHAARGQCMIMHNTLRGK